MLTGGFDVIGLFACASPDEWKVAQAKLRQVQFRPSCLLFSSYSAVKILYVSKSLVVFTARCTIVQSTVL